MLMSRGGCRRLFSPVARTSKGAFGRSLDEVGVRRNRDGGFDNADDCINLLRLVCKIDDLLYFSCIDV